MQDKKKVKIGSRIAAIMGVIWLGMTKSAHAVSNTVLNFMDPGAIKAADMTQTAYGIPQATKWANFLRGLWLPLIFLIGLIVGTVAYCKKGKNQKAKKILKIVTAILVILFVIWVILKVLAILI